MYYILRAQFFPISNKKGVRGKMNDGGAAGRQQKASTDLHRIGEAALKYDLPIIVPPLPRPP